MNRPLKKLIKDFLKFFGYDILERGKIRLSLANFVEHVSRLGFTPETVIDVGAANGTFELYEGFPHATHLLIEPLKEFEKDLKEFSLQFKTELVVAAADEKPGTIILNVHPVLTGSSIFKEIEGSDVDGTPREVKAVTIDELCREKHLKGPYLIKVDVQGGEIRVLNGARHVLIDTEVIILEVHLFQFFIRGPQFYDIVNYMRDKNFCVYDIFGHHYRPLDGALASVDIAFVKEDGHFRKSHHWASPEQRESITKSMLARQIQTGTANRKAQGK
jgi:FkbM family methyltransferase